MAEPPFDVGGSQVMPTLDASVFASSLATLVGAEGRSAATAECMDEAVPGPN
jgi:hypothetical protein